MTTKIIHFDSNNAVNNPTTIIDPVTSTLKTAYHSFNATYTLPQQLQSVKQIYLKSLELPITFCNIRSTMSPFGFTYTNEIGANINASFTQALPEATYTDIYAVVTALNTFMTTNSNLAASLLLAETVPVFSVVTINRDLRISYTMRIYPSSTFVLKEGFLTKTLLGYVASNDNKTVTLANRYTASGTYQADAQKEVFKAGSLGLTTTNDITTATTTNISNVYYPSPSLAIITQYSSHVDLLQSTTTFSNPCNINYDTYVNMTISNLPIVSANNNQYSCTFKIPINSTSNIVYLNGESNSFMQSVNINDSHFILDKLVVVITDRRGYAIQPNYGQYSFSIGIEFEATAGDNGNSGGGGGGVPVVVPVVKTPPPEIHYFTEF